MREDVEDLFVEAVPVDERALGVGTVLAEALGEVQCEAAGDTTPGPGQPGFYRLGQCIGRTPRDVWKHCVKKWQSVRGPSAVCRYPDKFPQRWEALCTSHPVDLIVSAFELWAHSTTYKELWATEAFARVADRWFPKIIPLNPVKSDSSVIGHVHPLDAPTDRITNGSLVTADDYVAWLRYTDGGSIVTCDSDAPGAFKVYRRGGL